MGGGLGDTASGGNDTGSGGTSGGEETGVAGGGPANDGGAGNAGEPSMPASTPDNAATIFGKAGPDLEQAPGPASPGDTTPAVNVGGGESYRAIRTGDDGNGNNDDDLRENAAEAAIAFALFEAGSAWSVGGAVVLGPAPIVGMIMEVIGAAHYVYGTWWLWKSTRWPHSARTIHHFSSWSVLVSAENCRRFVDGISILGYCYPLRKEITYGYSNETIDINPDSAYPFFIIRFVRWYRLGYAIRNALSLINHFSAH